MKKLLFLILGVCFMGVQLRGQEVHNSQFYSLPLFLNPANTGNSVYNVRAGIDYRNQWSTVSVPFSSESVYADVKLPCYFIEGSWFGLGIMLLNDVAGEGLKSTYGGLSFAFHKSVSRGNDLILSTGVTAEIVNRSVDYQKLVFDDQWDGTIFNPGYQSGDYLGAASLWYLDMAMGTKLSYYQKMDIYSVGFSVSHIMQPSESFYEITNNLARKYTLHGGVEKWFDRGNWMLNPYFVLDMQSFKTSALIGMNFYNPFDYYRTKSFIAGLWFRTTKEAIPTVGLEFDNIRVIASYDIPFANNTYKSRGGFELSVTYTVGYTNPIEQLCKYKYLKPRKKRRGAIPCPKFKTGQ